MNTNTTENPTRNYFSIFVQLGTLLLLLLSTYLFIISTDRYYEIYWKHMSNEFGEYLFIISIFIFIVKICFFGYLFILFLMYKPMDSVSDEELPLCTVIVPAYNEGSLVHKTLHSITQSDYPIEKLQIISIDDGSKDDTWKWICKAKEELGDRLEILQQPHNQGKRHALYRGFKIAKGDIFVTIDSDSIIHKHTLRNLVSPFVHDKKCGAVAGNVKVLNTEKALIPKMLNVSFTFSFEFVRSAQSVLCTVLCTPGALAAYKKEAVIACLPQWINQHFFGVKSDIGEDRAMTNMILKQGYNVRFQKNAEVLTNIPEKYSGLYKMFIRWERSNVRENIMMSRFAFGNFRSGSKIGPRILLLNQWLRIILAYPTIAFMILFLINSPYLYFVTKFVSILLLSSFSAIYFAINYHKKQSFWAYNYGIFYAFALFWITPYAILTARRKGWLTRGL